MLVIRQYRIYRRDLQTNPHILYIFGDNLVRQGMGGQAAEMRGEPNAFGIATKRKVSHNYREDYFYDEDQDGWDAVKADFLKLEQIKHEWDALVIPSDGIGTGLARLSENAPRLLAYINRELRNL